MISTEELDSLMKELTVAGYEVKGPQFREEDWKGAVFYTVAHDEGFPPVLIHKSDEVFAYGNDWPPGVYIEVESNDSVVRDEWLTPVHSAEELTKLIKEELLRET